MTFGFLKRDNVTWDEEQERLVQQKVNENSVVTVSSEELLKYETEANKYWDKFYGIHNDKYVKPLSLFSMIVY